MTNSQIFSVMPTWSVDQVRNYLDENPSETYTFLDVRQPEEYTEGHLPGAKLIPVREL
ncbi:MAG: rhodanese-like domain-containing protein, partial [Desulfobacterales bacterium]|nr:rhodanese-like domain-containing protein [Desulfobacterales bacterium]